MKMYATRNTVAAAIVFALLSGVAGISNAKLSHIDIASIRVNFADLNLTSAEEAATLYDRLRRAATLLCDDLTRKSVNDMVAVKECKEIAIDRAVREVGNPQLTNIHQG
jgi:UrcA family protein